MPPALPPRAEVRAQAARRALGPMDRISEVLFGLIMALTFTGSISAAEAGHSEVKTLLYGALGCNLAWGFVDGVMYVLACVSERGEAWRMARDFRRAPDQTAALDVVARALPPSMARALGPEGLEPIRATLAAHLEDPRPPRVTLEDLRGALAVFAFVFLSTLPVVVPFMLFQEPLRALRVSNAVAITMLFGLGVAFGRVAGLRPWLMGAAMVGVGVVLVVVTIALGG